MAVFRIDKTGDYTVMSNYHLRDKRLSLKAKGLLSQMLSLPEDWDYTLTGLTVINRESKDAVRSAVRELELAGYIHRRQTVDGLGRFSCNEYLVYEQPLLDSPLSENPTTEKPSSENPTQLIKELQSTEVQKTEGQKIESYPSDAIRSDLAASRETVKEQIEYDILLHDYPRERLDELVELLAETLCSTKPSLRIAGNKFTAEAVRNRLQKLECEHIRYVMDCMEKTSTDIRNIRQYLLAALFNAPATMDNYYANRVNHDLKQPSGWGSRILDKSRHL